MLASDVRQCFRLAGFAALGCSVVLGAGCGRRAAHPVNPNDPFSRVAGAELDHPCDAVAEAGSIPALPPTVSSAPTPLSPNATIDGGGDDVVAYLAHPYDEAFFTGGTFFLLGQKGRKAAVVLFSHGEGGRLLQVNERGEFVERYDVPKEKLVSVRADETSKAAKVMHVEVDYLYSPEANVDFGKTLECDETLDTWDQSVPGAVTGMLRKIVANIRRRRPRVIITHDPRSDSHWMEHGHNKAIGALVEAAARMAADPRVDTKLPPHVVEEFLTIAPADARHDITVPVGADARKKVLVLYPSQFRVDKASEAVKRSTEDYVLSWHAKGAAVPPSGSILAGLLK